jgi:hypothetical protein
MPGCPRIQEEMGDVTKQVPLSPIHQATFGREKLCEMLVHLAVHCPCFLNQHQPVGYMRTQILRLLYDYPDEFLDWINARLQSMPTQVFARRLESWVIQ